ncbi:hypothetical protein QE406_001592 [Microbacterium testaceum]|nr:hypothetical protein [Microbacterium sp. SORGH_AS_0969]MDQ1115583.1 hypothetical protein [Microbacterium testaceum]
MELSLGILAVSVAVAAAVLFAALPRIGTPGAMTLFLRYAAVSGVAAVGSSAMYFMYGAGGGIVALVLGDVAMVLAPALLLIALEALAGRRARRWATASLALVAVTAVVTATVSLPWSLVVKVLLLTVLCTACALSAARLRLEPRWPMRLILTANAAYATYSATRIIVGFIAGADSPLYALWFSFAPVTIAGTLAILGIGVAVVRVRVGPRAQAAPVACPAGRAVVVGDWALASAAYGPERMRAMVAELQSTARTFDETARDLPRGVEITMPDAITRLGDSLRDVYGWKPDEVALLVDGATTAAIHTHPQRTGRRRGRGSART